MAGGGYGGDNCPPKFLPLV